MTYFNVRLIVNVNGFSIFYLHKIKIKIGNKDNVYLNKSKKATYVVFYIVIERFSADVVDTTVDLAFDVYF